MAKKANIAPAPTVTAPAFVNVEVVRYPDRPHALGFLFEAEDYSDLYSQQVVDALVDYLLGEGASLMARDRSSLH